MKRNPPSNSSDPVADAVPSLKNFSLVLGGPLYQLLRRAHLDDDIVSHLKRRILVICGIVWLPLFVLCAATGLLTGGVRIPFLHDVESHARFLVAIPLMLVAELVVHQRTRGIVAQFIERKLVPEQSMTRFQQAITSAIAWRNSIWAELALVAIVLPVGFYLRTEVFALKTSTWYATIGPDGPAPTLPGIWFFWVSNPALQFLMLRWIFRLAIWGRFLWQVSRIDLDLIPTHPDRNGGLGFLGGSAYAFSPLLAAFSALVAGLVASRIFFEGASLPDFKLEIMSLVAIGMMLVFGPLTVFAPRVMAEKRSAKRRYGKFAAEYMRGFDRRWLHEPPRAIEEILGSPDIQSLADLDNAYSIIKDIKPVPFSRDTILQLVWATLAPFTPLVFTMIPFDELLNRLIKAVF
jgi:hypothetical protein